MLLASEVRANNDRRLNLSTRRIHRGISIGQLEKGSRQALVLDLLENDPKGKSGKPSDYIDGATKQTTRKKGDERDDIPELTQLEPSPTTSAKSKKETSKSADGPSLSPVRQPIDSEDERPLDSEDGPFTSSPSERPSSGHGKGKGGKSYGSKSSKKKHKSTSDKKSSKKLKASKSSSKSSKATFSPAPVMPPSGDPGKF